MVMQPAPRLPSFLDEAGSEGSKMSFVYEVDRELQETGGSALIDVLKDISYSDVLRGAGASALTGGYRPHLSCGYIRGFEDRSGFLDTQEHPLPNLRQSCKPPYPSAPSLSFLFLTFSSSFFLMFSSSFFLRLSSCCFACIFVF